MKLFKRATALLLTVCVCAGLALPLMGAALPARAADSGPTVGASENTEAPACFCDVRCTETTLNADCIVCAAGVDGCTGKEPEPPACICEVNCTSASKNAFCPVCADAGDGYQGCTGKEAGPEPEPTPICNCTEKCAQGSTKADCPVCAADATGCTGKEPEPEPAPTCDCTVKCEVGAVKADCPICKTDFTICTGKAPAPIPESGVSIAITPPSGWATKEADVSVRVTDTAGNGFAKAEVKIEKNGSWRDVTDSLTQQGDRYDGTVEISENCTLYVTVTGKDGKIHEKSRYIQCFDRTGPTLKAHVDGKLLRAEADDDLSGVAAIYIDGEKFTDLTNGTLDVRLRDLDNDFPQFSVQAVDEAGNKSKTVQVKNPNYKEPEDKQDSEKEDNKTECPEPTTKPTETPAVTPTPPATTTPTTTPTTPKPVQTTKPASTGSIVAKPPASASADPEQEADTEPREPVPLTPDGQGTVVDNVTGEDSKEFFTITTADENIFYLVIDRQRDSENVYFLNAVTESDLTALAEKDQPKQEESAIPEPEPVCTCKEQCVAGEVNTKCQVCVLTRKDCTGKAAPVTQEPEEKPEQGGSAGTIIFILIAALAVGGAGYYFKIYKPKQELDDAEDFDELTGGEEETVNEDEEPEVYAPQEDGTNDPADYDEPDYPGDYPDYDEPDKRG